VPFRIDDQWHHYGMTAEHVHARSRGLTSICSRGVRS
jgi:hypothetical protein